MRGVKSEVRWWFLTFGGILDLINCILLLLLGRNNKEDLWALCPIVAVTVVSMILQLGVKTTFLCIKWQEEYELGAGAIIYLSMEGLARLVGVIFLALKNDKGMKAYKKQEDLRKEQEMEIWRQEYKER